MGAGSIARGRDWEDRAAVYLSGRGLEILARTYRCRLGELDLVCRDGDTLIIVEVKARRNDRHGSAAESVRAVKQQRILKATRHFLMRHPHWNDAPIRFDVVAIDDIDGREPVIQWIRNAFDAA